MNTDTTAHRSTHRQAFLLCLTLSVSFASPALEAAHALEDITQTARQFIDDSMPATGKARKEVDIRPLDPRLQLPECSRPLTAFAPGHTQHGGLVTVGIRCEGESPWKIYVSGRVRLLQPVAVLARPLPKDGLIQHEDIEFREQDVNRLTKGFFTQADNLVGMTTRQAILRGEVVTPAKVQGPKAISKGQKVKIRAQNDAFEITMTGEALRDGGIGEYIKVRNLGSGKIIEALVRGAGEVVVSY